jgi:hypothetical protein
MILIPKRGNPFILKADDPTLGGEKAQPIDMSDIQKQLDSTNKNKSKSLTDVRGST